MRRLEVIVCLFSKESLADIGDFPLHHHQEILSISVTKSEVGMVGITPKDMVPSPAVKFFGAGTAACIADLITFPLDTAKVRLQVKGPIFQKILLITVLIC